MSKMRSDLPTGTVTFLFTDIEGSTKLSQEYADDLPVLLVRHKEILKQAINANHGFLFQVVGDAFSVAFSNATDALKAAAEAQRSLHNEVWSPTRIKIRMGIHTGAAKLADDSSIEGPYTGYTTLATTQRIMSAAHGGQILLSQITRDLLWEQLPAHIMLLDKGEHLLKDLLHPLHLYQATIAGLPTDFPPLKTLTSLQHNLPVQLTSFIGRDREIAETKQLLANTRLLTLIGPGGTGKTRLALKIAEDLLDTFVDGVWLVELAPLADPNLILHMILGIFGLRELPNTSLNNIVIDYLLSKELLLILDNCEHLIEACGQLSAYIMRNCPRVKIVASSRELFGIAGEMVYRVPSLSLPDQAHLTREALLGSESVQLFVERASASNRNFHLMDENASDVAQICRRLDGIPLALELAAARTAVFSTKQIAAYLDDRFRLLTGGSRAALERHQTLQALIDWSYDLLSEEERRLFRYLAVFAGGWTFAAAESVCSQLDVLNLLPQLINKSLVLADENATEMRYHLLETIRQYARDKLVEAGESEQIRNRHLDFFLKFAEEAESHFNSFREMEWMSRLVADNDNLRAALEWALERNTLNALRLGTALSPFWNRHGEEAEGCRILLEALAQLKALPPAEGKASRQRIALQVKALGALEVLSFAQGDFVSSLKVAGEVIELSRQIGEKYALSSALSYLGVVNAFLGDREISSAMAEEALTLAREVGDRILLGLALTNMAGVIAMTQGDPQKMQACTEEGIRLLKEAGAQWGVAMASFGSGLFASRQGNYAEARSQFEASIPVFRELKDSHRVNMAFSEIAHVERRQGHFNQAKLNYRRTVLEWQRLGHRAAIAHELECLAFIAKAEAEEQRAAILLGAAEILRENINLPMTPLERIEYEREVSDLRVNMNEGAFAKAWAKGRTLTMEEAIVLALEADDR